MTTPTVEGLLTVPYVGIQEFRASPTWLDTQDLIEGGDSSVQDAELYNQLLKASSWASDTVCNQPLHAHTAYEQGEARVDRWGNIWIHPSNNPVRAITGIAWGTSFQNLTVLSDLSQTWVEDERGVVVSMVPQGGGSYLGSLQFGLGWSPGGHVYVAYEYVAGYANTYLTAAASPADMQLTVADPTGFVPPASTVFGTSIGASVARIWDPGLEEAVTVSASYETGGRPVLLASGLANGHPAGVQVSEMPADLRQAVVMYTAGLLTREDASAAAPFPGSPGPAARRDDSRGVSGGLITEAERLLFPFRRVS